MSITYTWSVIPMGLRTATDNNFVDAVVYVHYQVEATDGVNTVSLQRHAQLTPGTEGNFTPFANLTETQVLAWVKDTLVHNEEAVFQTLLTKQLQEKANPPAPIIAKTAPWTTCAPR